MSERYPRNQAEDDQLFAELTGELQMQLTDPYLAEMHRLAMAHEEIVSTVVDGDINEIKKNHVQQLDRQWRYMGQPVKLTGKAWQANAGVFEPEPRMYVGEEGISRGFLFFMDTTEESTDHFPHISHLIEVDSGAGDGTRVHVVAPVADIVHLELPFPSPELRERRFAYHFPDDATLIDELNFTARRDDQVIRGFSEYYFDVNLDDPEQLEHARDAAQYLKSRAEIEPFANYHVSILGDVITVKDDNSGLPTRLAYPYSRTMKITDIKLRPADISQQTLEGIHRCVPFVEAIAFEPDGTERELIIPCSSIQWMSSTRYDEQKPPVF